MVKPNGTTARGYGSKHQQLRKQWAKVIEAGQGVCHAKICTYPSRFIPPGAAWDLGHNDDRTRWTGPEHARCNRRDGGKKRHAKNPSARRSWEI